MKNIKTILFLLFSALLSTHVFAACEAEIEAEVMAEARDQRAPPSDLSRRVYARQAENSKHDSPAERARQKQLILSETLKYPNSPLYRTTLAFVECAYRDVGAGGGQSSSGAVPQSSQATGQSGQAAAQSGDPLDALIGDSCQAELRALLAFPPPPRGEFGSDYYYLITDDVKGYIKSMARNPHIPIQYDIDADERYIQKNQDNPNLIAMRRLAICEGRVALALQKRKN